MEVVHALDLLVNHKHLQDVKMVIGVLLLILHVVVANNAHKHLQEMALDVLLLIKIVLMAHTVVVLLVHPQNQFLNLLLIVQLMMMVRYHGK
jgi:hypothetical protein